MVFLNLKYVQLFKGQKSLGNNEMNFTLLTNGNGRSWAINLVKRRARRSSALAPSSSLGGGRRCFFCSSTIRRQIVGQSACLRGERAQLLDAAYAKALSTQHSMHSSSSRKLEEKKRGEGELLTLK